MDINLTLNREDIDFIVGVLMEHPAKNVMGLLVKLSEQIKNQISLEDEQGEDVILPAV